MDRKLVCLFVCKCNNLIIYSAGIVRSPESICACKSFGDCPFTVHPTANAVPKTSLTVPTSFFAIDFVRKIRAILMTASNVMLPLCLMFLTFFRSLGGSFSSFKIMADAVGIIVGVACWKEKRNIANKRKMVRSYIGCDGSRFIFVEDEKFDVPHD